MFAVMGVTGQVGRAVANTLIDHGGEVRVIVRSESKARPWAARGADVVVAAIENLEAMAAALRGVKGAFVMLPPIFDPSPGFPEAKAAIAELKAALIKATPPKVVVLSTIGAAEPAQPAWAHGGGVRGPTDAHRLPAGGLVHGERRRRHGRGAGDRRHRQLSATSRQGLPHGGD